MSRFWRLSREIRAVIGVGTGIGLLLPEAFAGQIIPAAGLVSGCFICAFAIGKKGVLVTPLLLLGSLFAVAAVLGACEGCNHQGDDAALSSLAAVAIYVVAGLPLAFLGQTLGKRLEQRCSQKDETASADGRR